MRERYVKVFSGEPNLFTENAPVVIQASALLKDTETGKMIAQLKFQNISGKVISYVKATITQLDAVSNPLGDAMAFEYLDLSAADKDDFGSKKPLPLPNASTRAFRVGVSTVGFADGSVWTGDNTDWKAEEKDSAVSKAVEVETAYKKALALSKSKSIEDVKKAKEIYESIQADKDVATEISLCEDRIVSSNAKDKKKKKTIKLSVFLAICLVLITLLGYFVIYPFVALQTGNYKVYIDMYNIKHLNIPNGITEIKNRTFLNYDMLESVTIPDSVTTIGSQAFSGCSGLTSITIPDSVTTIDYDAFWGCSSLTSITIPDSVTIINNGAFSGCSSLTSITIPSSVTTIDHNAFWGCSSLTSITIPSSVTTIGNMAFSGCSSLTSITIPSSVTAIGSGAFYGCSNLTEIHFDGTKEQWKAIDESLSWNYYTIYCTDGIVTRFS